MRKTRVFVCGPIRGKPGDSLAMNLNRALKRAGEVWDAGYAVYVPHANYLWEMVVPHEEQRWMEHDKAWLAVCDVVLRLPGQSAGSDAEVDLATELGIPIYHHLDELLAEVPRERRA